VARNLTAKSLTKTVPRRMGCLVIAGIALNVLAEPKKRLLTQKNGTNLYAEKGKNFWVGGLEGVSNARTSNLVQSLIEIKITRTVIFINVRVVSWLMQGREPEK